VLMTTDTLMAKNLVSKGRISHVPSVKIGSERPVSTGGIRCFCYGVRLCL
jgi:hypothetical protein